jgi:glucosamine-6-phosphate deaminase
MQNSLRVIHPLNREHDPFVGIRGAHLGQPLLELRRVEGLFEFPCVDPDRKDAKRGGVARIRPDESDLRFDPEQTQKFAQRVRDFLNTKPPGAVDIPDVQDIKARLRRSEALAACRSMGISTNNATFLDLPFYQTGEVRKLPIGSEDVAIVLALIRKIRPHWIFLAGELSDPHGTHRLCAEAIYAALAKLESAERPEVIWLYRGAWQEWDPHVIDMAIPLSKSELTQKIFGIFKHQSQKDKALFPGSYDNREFWQRAEARNADTAATYNKLGLAEHYAMEAFVRYEPS